MKYILSFLLLISLYSCSSSAGHTVKNISTQVKKCCSSLSLNSTRVCLENSPAETKAAPASVIAVSLLERSADILTW